MQDTASSEADILDEATGTFKKAASRDEATIAFPKQTSKRQYTKLKNSHNFQESLSSKGKEKKLAKHRMACRKNRRTPTLFKKAMELNLQNTNQEVFVAVQDTTHFSFFSSPGRMLENFANARPLQYNMDLQVHQITPSQFQLDASKLKEVSEPSPKKMKGKLSSILGPRMLQASRNVEMNDTCETRPLKMLVKAPTVLNINVKGEAVDESDVQNVAGSVKKGPKSKVKNPVPAQVNEEIVHDNHVTKQGEPTEKSSLKSRQAGAKRKMVKGGEERKSREAKQIPKKVIKREVGLHDSEEKPLRKGDEERKSREAKKIPKKVIKKEVGPHDSEVKQLRKKSSIKKESNENEENDPNQQSNSKRGRSSSDQSKSRLTGTKKQKTSIRRSQRVKRETSDEIYLYK